MELNCGAFGSYMMLYCGNPLEPSSSRDTPQAALRVFHIRINAEG